MMSMMFPNAVNANFAVYGIIALGLLLGIIFAALTGKNKDASRFLINLFIIIFVIRLLFAIFYYCFNLEFGTPTYEGLVGDSFSFTKNGSNIALIWESKLAPFGDHEYITDLILSRQASRSGTMGNYDFWCAYIFYYIGHNPLLLIFLNCIFSSFTAILVYIIAKQLSNENAAKYAAVLAGLWPSLIFWSIQNLKEPLTVFLLTGLIAVFMGLMKRFRFYYLTIILIFSATLYFIRQPIFYAFYYITIPLSLFFYFGVSKLKKEVIIFFVIVIVLIGTFIFADTIGVLVNQAVRDAARMRSGKACGNLAFLRNIDFSSPAKLLAYMPLLIIFAFFAPFPWQVGTSAQLIAIPETIVYYVLFVSFIKGTQFVIRHKPRYGGLVVTFVFVMFFILAIMEGNSGTLFRHRSLLLPMWFVLTGIGVDLSRKAKRDAHATKKLA